MINANEAPGKPIINKKSKLLALKRKRSSNGRESQDGKEERQSISLFDDLFAESLQRGIKQKNNQLMVRLLQLLNTIE